MAQAKHTFVESKMNKDLDDRLLSGGQYRNAINAAVSKSEDSDVGALENVLGNFEISNLFPDNLVPPINLETIGAFMSSEKDTIYVFLTNFCDTSTSGLGLKAPAGAECLIAQYEVKTKQSQILVSGSFLNFSTTNYITGINLIEDLLFWTDNRNQPRKINVVRAKQDNTYYTTEDQISVLKYAPYKPINILDTTVVSGCTLSNDTFRDQQSTKIEKTNVNFANIASPFDLIAIGNELYNIAGIDSNDIQLVPQVAAGTFDITIFKNTALDKTSKWLPVTARLKLVNNTNAPITTNPVSDIQATQINATWMSPRVEPFAVAGTPTPTSFDFDSNCSSNVINPVNRCRIDLTHTGQTINTLFLEQSITVNELSTVFIDISLPNPHYDTNFAGDENNLKDKFVRFGYRFKYDDNEYSIISPFTQPVFIPEQDGYFLNTTEDYNNIGASVVLDQAKQAGETTIVNKFENKVNQVKLNFDFDYPVNQLNRALKVKELQILYKESDALALKVIDDIDFTQNNLEVVNNSTNTYSYTYQSAKPFKTLPSEVITRTGDKGPIRALAQETSGNRIIYGNYVDKHTSPLTLDYLVSTGEKLGPAADGTTYTFAQYPNHTLKQNRTYQVGVVLQDRYGRQSDVILAPPLDGPQVEFPQGSGNFYGDSTVYHGYKDGDFWQNTLNWKGDSLKVLFRNSIPEILPNREGYPGLYSADNPLGWYSYKIVVKQKQQEYYNVYLPSLLYGTPLGETVEVIWDQLCSTAGSSKFVAAFGTTLSGLQSTRQLKPGMKFILYTGYFNNGASPGPGTQHVKTITKILDGETIEFTPDMGAVPAYAYCEDDGTTDPASYNNCCAKSVQNCGAPAPGGCNVGLANSQPSINITFFAAQTVSIDATTATETDEFTTTLLTDNINKLPADLQEVRPNQLQYKTSEDEVFPRVGRLLSRAYVATSQSDPFDGVYFASNIDTGQKSDNIKILGNFNDIFAFEARASNLYKESTNPNTATFTNTFQIGTESLAPAVFSVLETEPVISELDIFWETTTTGLISDLNAAVITVSNVNGIGGELLFDQNESDAASPASPLNVGKVFAVDGTGTKIASGGITLISVFDGNGNNFSNDYQLGTLANNEYPLEAINDCVFTSDPNNNNRIFVFEVIDNTDPNNIITNNYTYTTSISNAQPVPEGVSTTGGTGLNGYPDNPVETQGVDYNYPAEQVIVGDTSNYGTQFDNKIYANNGSVAEFFVSSTTMNEYSELTFELQVALDDNFTQIVAQNNTVVVGGQSNVQRGGTSQSTSFPAYDGIYLKPNGTSNSNITPASYNIPNGVTGYTIYFDKSVADLSTPAPTFSDGDERYLRIKISDCNGINGTSFIFLGSNLTNRNGIKITFVDGNGSGGSTVADGKIEVKGNSQANWGAGNTFYQCVGDYGSNFDMQSQSTVGCTGNTNYRPWSSGAIILL